MTNTKLTSDATDYAKCVGMHAIGWSYPLQDGLEVHIEKNGLHPVTCLTNLNRFQKQELVGRGYILCKDIIRESSVLGSVGCDQAKIAALA